MVQSSKKVYYVDVTWQTLQGPTGNDVMTQGDVNSDVCWSRWNNHLYITNSDYAPLSKIYIDENGDKQIRTAGMPALVSTPSYVATPGAESYIYAFVYFYEYKIGTVTFQDYGPVTQLLVDSVDAPDSNTITINAIPVVSNGANYNYDTTNMKVKIYRTQTGGGTFYYLDEVSNGTTSYVDSTADSVIANNSLLYTEGGVLDNDPPPLSKVMHVADGYGWYGHIKSGT